MLQPSSTISLLGESQNKATPLTFLEEDRGTPATPLLDFATSELGASQLKSKSSHDSFSTLQASPAPLSSVRTAFLNSPLPSGVVFQPKLNAARAGRSPVLRTRQLWEGTVTEVRKDGTFVALLRDKTNPQNPDEQATFDNSETSQDDLRFIIPGAAFYWVLGNEQDVAKQVKNVSMIFFRRVPAWTDRKLRDAANRAARLHKLLQDLG